MRAEIIVHAAEIGAEVSPLIYGQYVEHVADCVYPGIYDPDSPLADARGLREDVAAAAAELGVPVMRWPGGCFADVYHWRDGVGPSGERPVTRNWHWGGTEPNTFGTDEFLTWCERIGALPYVNLNLGTGTLDEALRWMDYCLGTADTPEVRGRRSNGRERPYRVGFWGIGNETWAPWEAGGLDARSYARTLANWADFARRYDPAARIVAVGSQEGADPAWDRQVLDAAGEHLSYLTNHLYGYTTRRGGAAERLEVVFTPIYIEARLRAMADTIARYERDTGNGPIRIALDEWNIRHFGGQDGTELDRASPRTVQDAVFAAGVLNAMIRMAPAVGMANYVFLVNGNGILDARGDHLVTSTLYHLFAAYRTWMRGCAVAVDMCAPTIPTPEPRADRPGYRPVLDGVPARSAYLDAAAVRDEGSLTLALVNRHPTEAVTVTLTGAGTPHTSWTLTHDDADAVNDVRCPDRVSPRTHEWQSEATDIACPPQSVTLVRTTLDGAR